MASAGVPVVPRPPQQEIDEMRLRKMDMSTIEWAIHLSKYGAAEKQLIRRYTFRTPTKTQAAKKAKMAKVYKRAYYAQKKRPFKRFKKAYKTYKRFKTTRRRRYY